MSLFQNVIKLGFANVALLTAQAISILILGIFIEAKGFAIFLLGLSIAQPVAAFAALRFDSAVPAANSDRELRALASLSTYSVFTIAAFLTIGLFFVQKHRFFELDSLPLFSIFNIVFLTICLSATQFGRYWAIRHDLLIKIEYATYTRAALTALFRGLFIAVFWNGSSEITDIQLGGILLLLELFIMLATTATILPRISWSRTIFGSNRLELRATWRRNWKFPALETPSTMLDVFALNAPIFLVTHFFGLTATASFGLAYRVLAVPIGQLGLALTEVMQSHYSGYERAKDSLSLSRLFGRSSILLLIGGVAGCLTIALVFENAVVTILGEDMRQFAEICVVISPWIAANLLVNINSRLLPLLKRQELKLIYDCFSFAAVPAIFFTQQFAQLSLLQLVATMSIISTLGYIIYWLLIRIAVTGFTRVRTY